jgi:hypothetical protein
MPPIPPLRSVLTLSSHLHLGLPSGLLPLGLPTKTLYTLLLFPCVLHALPISVFFIWSSGWYLVRNTDCEVKCEAFVFFVPWLCFYGEALSAPRPTAKLEDHPLSDIRDCLFNIFAATFHTCRPFLQPRTEDVPCRCDRDLLMTGQLYKHTKTCK